VNHAPRAPGGRSALATLTLATLTLASTLGACRSGAPPDAPRTQVTVPPPDDAGPGAVRGERDDGAADAGEAGGKATPWLRVDGPRIVGPGGRPFRGRGANLHDTRSCDSCAWEKPHVEEVLRRADVLVDDWRATFVRLLLESYPDRGQSPGRVHYRNVIEDDAYLQDVVRIVEHVGRKPGVYLLLSLWHDPSLGPTGWPTERTRAVWRKLARAFRDAPHVLFGLVNEPQANKDGRLDGEVWTAMNETVAAIRAVEAPDRRHVITVQGTREWGRVLDYYVSHPITAGGGVNVAYETHVYDRPARFDELVTRPSRKLPVIVGEMGPVSDSGKTMLLEDCSALMDLAERLDVPWLAYSFHTNCPPDLLEHHAGTCALGVPLAPSPWGALVRARLTRPW